MARHHRRPFNCSLRLATTAIFYFFLETSLSSDLSGTDPSIPFTDTYSFPYSHHVTGQNMDTWTCHQSTLTRAKQPPKQTVTSYTNAYWEKQC